MNFVAVKMLTGDRSKYLGFIFQYLLLAPRYVDWGGR